MKDKNLQELQDILRDAFMLQARMHAYMARISSGPLVLNADEAERYRRQHEQLMCAGEHTTTAIDHIWNAVGAEMAERETHDGRMV